jgi:pimeloyl-ACP methyl ester carboxylesterase
MIDRINNLITSYAVLFILFLAANQLGFAQSVGTARRAAHPAKMPRIAMEEMFVPGKDPRIQLYVRNKHPVGMSVFAPERTVLFVHGATYPSETTFDLALGGFSWMDYIAEHGYDVYLMDVRGYGRSTRPPQMNAPASKNSPFADTLTATSDVSAVVDFILARRGLKRLDLLACSWGTATCSTYAAANAGKVERLVLYAPLWIGGTPSLLRPAGSGPLGAYRTVDREGALSRWMVGVPEEKKATLIPLGWFDEWWAATVATDPVGSRQNPAVLRAPNGVVQDAQKFWSAGKPIYDPAKITAPVLMIQAEWDHDLPPYMDRALFPLLVNSPEKRYVMIGEGTHTVMMERNRMQLFREVQWFLDEGSSDK